MVVQATNTGGDLGQNHFDIAVGYDGWIIPLSLSFLFFSFLSRN
jgi:hypothetical protein